MVDEILETKPESKKATMIKSFKSSLETEKIETPEINSSLL